MDASQFDRLTRIWSSLSRRGMLLTLVGSILAVPGSRQPALARTVTGLTDGHDRRRGAQGKRRCRAGLRGGILATFAVAGERFRAWVTDPRTIKDIHDLRDETSQANIPNGRLRRGPGRARHNAPWHWHLDPQEIEMAQFTTEVCDARPSYVEANRRTFIDQVGRYCPWSARLVDVADCR